MTPYLILATCNPKMTSLAIGIEPRVGAMLLCNVILRAVDGGVEVSAIATVASMQAIDNPELHAVAGQVRDLLAAAVAAIRQVLWRQTGLDTRILVRTVAHQNGIAKRPRTLPEP